MSGEFTPNGDVSEVINKGFKSFQSISKLPGQISEPIQQVCAEWQEMFVAGALAELEQFRTLEKHIRENTLTTEVAQELLGNLLGTRAEAANHMAALTKRLQALLKPADKTTVTTNESNDQ